MLSAICSAASRAQADGGSVQARLPKLTGHEDAAEPANERYRICEAVSWTGPVPRISSSILSAIRWAASRSWSMVSLPFIPSCLPTTARVSGTDIILSSRFCNRPWARSSQCFFRRIVPANLCKGMRMPAASTSPQRGIDRIRAGVVRPRGVRNDDADRRPWARKRPFRTRPAERVVHPVCPCRATSGSLNRDNSRGMSQECAANAAR